MEKNSLATDDEEKVNNLLASKIDEFTGGEMKKVGAQKMENEVTIKKLDREYVETKKNLIYSKKMLEEARKNIATQTETKNQLLHANKEIIEKFNELKKYQNEITLINISKEEKSLQNCLDRNKECSRILNIILEKDNYFHFLNKNLFDKEKQLNEDIQGQIEENKKSFENSEETLLLLKKRYETQKMQIHGEKNDNRVKLTIEERNRRIIQLQADAEAARTQLKQETNDLQQQKIQKIQTREKLKNDVKIGENHLADLQSQLSEIEKQLMAQNENLENVKMKIKNVSGDIQRKRDANSQSNEISENNVANLQSELNSLKSELQKEQIAFSEIENKMQEEMKKLFTELEEKKKMQCILENRQHELSKLKEKHNMEQQKLSSQSSELENKLTSLSEEYKKQISIGSAYASKHIELNVKIKDLREKRDNAKKRLENLNVTQSQADKSTNYTSYNSRSSAGNTMSSQQINSEQKLYDFSRNNRKLDETIPCSQIPKKTSSHLETNKSVSFNVDSSDESEDESQEAEKPPKNSEALSQSEILFDRLISSQRPAETSINKKDEDVFKVPAVYASVKKRSTTQSKKY